MAKKYNASMFDKIKDALKKTERTPNSSFANIMKFPAGHTYTIRLIPDVEGLEQGEDKTFFHHYVNSWTSKKDGSFISAISLKSFGERDPINEARWKLYKDWKDSGPAKDEKFENPIKEREGWLVKAYWVDNPHNSELNGQVQILNMGPQLKEIVDDAMTGNRSDEFGAAIFDLSKDGCDFKIVAEEQGVFTTYKKSFFTTKTKLDLSDEEIEEIYNNTLDLTQLYPVKTFEELQSLLEEHFYTEGDDVSVKTEKKPLAKKEVPAKKEVLKKESPKKADKSPKEEEPSDEIPMFHETGDSSLDDLLSELEID